ncbi:hypothetical protein F4818DRAFT_439648 [Hypoxylon cercidicola]|nr:hypothetical protein F4818DRAFT_439648 [Hypoxylon cercidicola]
MKKPSLPWFLPKIRQAIAESFKSERFDLLLRPILLRTAESGADVRHAEVTSYGHNQAPPGGIQFEHLRESDAMGSLARYGQNKLAHILYCEAMAKRYPQTTNIPVYPGVGNTGLLRAKCLFTVARFLLQSTTQCAHNPLRAAAAPLEKLENGQYYEPVGKEDGRFEDGRKRVLG